MPTPTDADETTEQPRVPLSRRRVLHAAVELADRDGLGALTMRGLAQELGVEAMSLYHHVANKEAVLDGVVEVVVTEILEAVASDEAPDPERDWQAALRWRILTARDVLLRHPWAPRVLETRTTFSMEVIGYFDGVVGILRAGGFSYDLAHHAMHALGSRALGFTPELFQPDPGAAAEVDPVAMFEQMAEHFPHIVGMMAESLHDHDDPDSTLGWCDAQSEFEFGLDVLLDGLERRRASA